jgi:release factor glutamine methyltransferase
MRGLMKYIVSSTYKPLLVKYLSKTRTYSYKGINLEVPPEVFHPGFFFSTKLLLRYISNEYLSGKTFLELGAGSGLLGIYAAKKGALVVASDINPASIKCVKANAEENDVEITIIQSDVFDSIPQQGFDFILINPPYYRKNPSSFSDYAWYCGEEGEYFQKLFKDLTGYMHEGSKALMVLCDGCDLNMIKNIAQENFLRMRCVRTRQTIIETNFIFRIERIP